MSETLAKIEKFRRDQLQGLVDQLTPSQQRFFHRLYPKGPYEMADSKVDWGIEQCEMTIAKNRKLNRVL